MANLNEFRSSLETTKLWIDELMATVGTDEVKACRALRVTLQKLRDHLTVEETADLAAQLPLLIRGLFYEGWRPAGKPVHRCTKEEFLDAIGESFKEMSRLDEIEKMVCNVFLFLDRRISSGEVKDIVNSLPKDLRTLWPSYAGERCSA